MPDTQLLYLLRHAKAEPWHPGVNDFERPLCERGRHHMRALARWAEKELATPNLVLCSPSARTRGTLEPFAEVWTDVSKHTRYEPGMYEAGARTLEQLARTAFGQVDTVMMIGHNPGFELLALMVLEGPQAKRIGKLPPGGLAVIEFPEGWLRDAGRGRLQQWIRRKDVLRAG